MNTTTDQNTTQRTRQLARSAIRNHRQQLADARRELARARRDGAPQPELDALQATVDAYRVMVADLQRQLSTHRVVLVVLLMAHGFTLAQAVRAAWGHREA